MMKLLAALILTAILTAGCSYVRLDARAGTLELRGGLPRVYEVLGVTRSDDGVRFNLFWFEGDGIGDPTIPPPTPPAPPPVGTGTVLAPTDTE